MVKKQYRSFALGDVTRSNGVYYILPNWASLLKHKKINVRKLLTKKHPIFLPALYSAAKFTFCNANSRKFTKFHNISREFTKSFFLPVFHKKSFVLKTIHVTPSYRKNKRFFVKKPIRGYFERCLPSIPVEKKIS
jgi:hypothetical protein